MFEGMTKKDAVAKENSVIRKNPSVFHKYNRKDEFSDSRISIRPYPLQAQSSNLISKTILCKESSRIPCSLELASE